MKAGWVENRMEARAGEGAGRVRKENPVELKEKGYAPPISGYAMMNLRSKLVPVMNAWSKAGEATGLGMLENRMQGVLGDLQPLVWWALRQKWGRKAVPKYGTEYVMDLGPWKTMLSLEGVKTRPLVHGVKVTPGTWKREETGAMWAARAIRDQAKNTLMKNSRCDCVDNVLGQMMAACQAVRMALDLVESAAPPLLEEERSAKGEEIRMMMMWNRHLGVMARSGGLLHRTGYGASVLGGPGLHGVPEHPGEAGDCGVVTHGVEEGKVQDDEDESGYDVPHVQQPADDIGGDEWDYGPAEGTSRVPDQAGRDATTTGGTGQMGGLPDDGPPEAAGSTGSVD